MRVDKKILRKEMLARRDALNLQERKEKSERIAKLVVGINEFQNANVLRWHFLTPVNRPLPCCCVYLETDRCLFPLKYESKLLIDLALRPLQIGIAHDVIRRYFLDESIENLAHSSVYAQSRQ